MSNDISIYAPTLDATINYLKSHYTNYPIYDDNDNPLPYTNHHNDIAVNAYNHICSDIDYYVVSFNSDTDSYDDIMATLIGNININPENEFDYGIAHSTFIHIYHAVIKGYFDAHDD